MKYILAITFGAILWRLRGAGGDIASPAWAWALVFSLLVAVLMIEHGVPVWFATVYALWINIGERPGWGAPLGQVMDYPDPGREPEWYQRLWGGYLWRHPWQALAFRGAMIGGIGAIALPLGAWLANRLEQYLPELPILRGKWEWQEAFFGALFILILEVIIHAAT